MKKIIYLALALAAMASCQQNDEQIAGGDKVAARFTDAVITRATATAWEAGDAIGIYMLPTGATLTDAAVKDGAKNIRYTVTDIAKGTFAPAVTTEQIYYPADGSVVDFYAYYPHQAAIVDGIYKVDLTDQTVPAAIDLMTSTAMNMDKTYPTVPLSFGHRLSKLSLTLTAGTGFTAADLAGMTITVKGLPATADYNIGTAALSNPGAATPIATKVNAAGTAADAILIPQKVITEGSVQLLFTLADGRKFSWNLPATDLESGSRYQYNLKLSLPGVKLVSKNITNWTANSQVDGGTADKVSQKLYSVGDYYPDPSVTFSSPGVVESGAAPIGIVYWLDDKGGGKIVSLNESTTTLNWGPNNAETDATNVANGLINMQTIKKLNSNFSSYPAFAYVNEPNSGTPDYAEDSKGIWYLPAKQELMQLYAGMSGLRWVSSGTVAGTGDIKDWTNSENMPAYGDYATARTDFNIRLTAAGGTSITASWYWSSSEYSFNPLSSVWALNFDNGSVSWNSKLIASSVRACLAF